MATLEQLIQTRLANLEAAYVAEKTKIEADLAGLSTSGWLQRDETELRTWLADAESHVAGWVAAAKSHLGL